MTDAPAERHRYLVELAAPEAGWTDVEWMLRRARSTASGTRGPRFIRSIFVPEDSRFYLLYEAASVEEARLAATRADLEVAGISEALRTKEAQP